MSEARFVPCHVVYPGDGLCAPERGACSAEVGGVFCIHMLGPVGVEHCSSPLFPYCSSDWMSYPLLTSFF